MEKADYARRANASDARSQAHRALQLLWSQRELSSSYEIQVVREDATILDASKAKPET